MKLSKIYSQNRLLILLVSILVILIGLPVVILLILNRTMTVIAWYDTNWEHRKTVTVSNDIGSTLNNEDVLVTVDTASLISEGKLQSDCGDLRFVDSDNSSVLDYWIEGGCGTSTTEVWVQVPSLPSAGKTIYMYYANSTATNGGLSWSGNYISMFNGSCPSGWSRVTALDNRFPMGSSSYGNTGGSSTHTHTYTQIGTHSHNVGTLATVSAGAHTHDLWYSDNGTWYSAYVTYRSVPGTWKTGAVQYSGAHTHTISGSTGSTGISTGTTDPQSNLPPYQDFVFCSPDNKLTLGNIPANSLFLFDSLPSSGYTRFTNLDNKFPRASTSAGGTGGSSSHTHTYSQIVAHSHGAGTLAAASAGSHTHDLLMTDGVAGGPNHYPNGNGNAGEWKGGTVSTTGNHSHTLTNNTASAGNASCSTESTTILPSYKNMIFGLQSSNSDTFTSGAITLFDSNPPLGWDRYTSLDNKFPRGASSSGTTGESTSHNHSYTCIPAHTHSAGSLVTNTTGDHWHGLRNSGSVGGYPLYVGMSGYASFWDSGYVSTAGAHTHTITGTTASAGTSGTMYTSSTNPSPPYIETIYSQRKDSQNTTLGEEDSPVPDAPTVETPIPTSTTEITWNFIDNSTDELGFKVYDENNVLKVTCDTPNISSCLETGLNENTQYTRKIVAYNSFGDSQFSDTISAYTKASTVSIVDLISTIDTVTVTSSTFANDNLGSSGYYFDCTDTSCDTGINEWISTSTDILTALENNTGYNIRVKNRNGDGVENPYSTESEIWTKASTPSISLADTTDTTITLQGSGINNLAHGSSGLYFDCTVEESCDSGVNQWVSTNTDTVIDLLPDKEYQFKVKARNYDGIETDYSEGLTVYTDSTQPNISLINEQTTNSLKVTINNHDNPTTTLYLLEEVNTAKYLNFTGELVNDPVWLTYSQLGLDSGITITELSSNTEYSFRIKAKNQNNMETEYSDPVSAYTRLESPTSLSPETVTDTSIIWKISTTEMGYDGIKVYDNANNLITTCMGLDITECEEIQLLPNTDYNRKFTIYNSHSESEFSLLISQSTLAQAVSISTISALNDYEVSLSINLQNNPIGTKLQIFEENSSKYLSEELGILINTQGSIVSTGNPITVSGLLPNTEYIFKVRAIDNEDNATAWSVTSTVRTHAEIPNIVSSQAISTNSGTLTIDLGNNPVGTEISILENGGKYLNEAGNLVDLEQIFTLSEDTITISDLEPNTVYTFKVRAYNEDNVITEWSNTLDLITYIEDPILEIIDQTSESMTLEISGLSNIEIEDSGIYVDGIDQWSNELTQTITELTPNTLYTFNVKARNSDGIETAYIQTEPTYTLATIPSISETEALSTTSGILTIDLGQNPEGTRIAIKEVNSGKYLNSSGNLVSEENILTLNQHKITVNGLSSNNTYDFEISAYNENEIQTEYSSETYSLTTLIQTPTLSVSNITSSSVDIVVSGLDNISTGDTGIFIERLSAWSKNLTQTVTDLNANTSYTFRVRVRNKEGIATTYISTDEVQTFANIPAISSVRKLSSNSARVYLDNSNNPSYTQLAIRDRVSNQYVNANGQLQTQPVWMTYSQWGGGLGVYVSGIDELRQVGFEIKARNRSGIETAFSDAEYIGTGSVIRNIPTTITANLKDNEDVDLSSEAQLGIQEVRLTKDEYIVADIKVSFEQDRDWENVIADTDIENSKTVIKVTPEQGISEPFTMYVVRNDTNAFRICPNAENLEEIESGCTGEKLLTQNFPQEVEVDGNTITISEAKIDGTYYWIADGLTGTGGMGEYVEIESPEEETDQSPVEKDQEVESVSTIGKRIIETVNRISKDIILGTTEILDNTPIGELNQQELNTAVVTTTTVTITVSFASTGLIQSFYFIFHFINSLLNALGFRRKQKPFGYVYDSSNKEPISNAVIRIYKGKKLIETTVTNSEGMFLSKLEQGEYHIEIKKGGYKFPTKLVKGKEDYPLKNIYKGGTFVKTETSDLILNIPLDRVALSESKKFLTILKSLTSVLLMVINISLFIFGILLLIYTYYKYPELFSWYMLLLYIPALYFLSKSVFSKRTVYGKVIDSNGDPVVDKELYLVDKEFNEVVAKRITDEKGRYRFVCKKGEYQLKLDNKVLIDDIKARQDGYILTKRVKLSS